MDRKVKSFRLRVDLLDWLKAYAATRGSTEVSVLEMALASFKRDAEGGVPDLPEPEVVVAPKPVSPVPTRESYEQTMRARHRALAKEMGWAP